jgi:hypothetical protein
MNKSIKQIIILILVLSHNIILSLDNMSIVPNDRIILSDYKIVNNELGIKIPNKN